MKKIHLLFVVMALIGAGTYVAVSAQDAENKASTRATDAVQEPMQDTGETSQEELFAQSLPAEEEPTMTKAGAYQFSFKSIDGKDMPLSDFAGKVVMIVNTASQCGFTTQYRGLQKLYETYEEHGFVIIGVPCNDFGGQEPGTEEEVKQFVKDTYSVTFPMTSKYSVKGDDAHPFFVWAAKQRKGGFFFSSPKWNFHKFLIDRDGQLYRSYGSQVKPMSDEIKKDIEGLLAKSEG